MRPTCPRALNHVSIPLPHRPQGGDLGCGSYRCYLLRIDVPPDKRLRGATHMILGGRENMRRGITTRQRGRSGSRVSGMDLGWLHRRNAIAAVALASTFLAA